MKRPNGIGLRPMHSCPRCVEPITMLDGERLTPAPLRSAPYGVLPSARGDPVRASGRGTSFRPPGGVRFSPSAGIEQGTGERRQTRSPAAIPGQGMGCQRSTLVSYLKTPRPHPRALKSKSEPGRRRAKGLSGEEGHCCCNKNPSPESLFLTSSVYG